MTGYLFCKLGCVPPAVVGVPTVIKHLAYGQKIKP